MRLWSLHPKYLDAKGLVALWREGLLARKVLEGHTRGYLQHPQLERFRNLQDPLMGIESYLAAIFEEALDRNYHFDSAKISRLTQLEKIPVTEGQLQFERGHLLAKLIERDPARWLMLDKIASVEPHPMFYIIPGKKEVWERG